MTGTLAFNDHLATGLTSVCRAWSLTRVDGTSYGFTDHDGDLVFEGVTFHANTGLTAMALQQTTGLAIDNTEAIGALTQDAMTEEDILAGRFDGAEVVGWHVNWQDLSQREIVFRGTIGEITRVDGAFRAEILGLSERLNRPTGRILSRRSQSIEMEAETGTDLSAVPYTVEGELRAALDAFVFDVELTDTLPEDWFAHGKLTFVNGKGFDLGGAIKVDTQLDGTQRRIELWEPITISVEKGDRVQLVVGCDGTMEDYRAKFGSILNFQGFPDIPEDDWMINSASSSRDLSGGSRR